LHRATNHTVTMQSRKTFERLALACELRGVTCERPATHRILLTVADTEPVAFPTVERALDYLRGLALPVVTGTRTNARA